MCIVLCNSHVARWEVTVADQLAVASSERAARAHILQYQIGGAIVPTSRIPTVVIKDAEGSILRAKAVRCTLIKP